MPSNSAAWLVAEKTKPLEVGPAPYTSPGENEIVVKNRAVAINPVDYGLQEKAFLPLNYPAILGSDVAGEVVEVGSSVTRFRVGDRVLGQGIFMDSSHSGTFQEYTVLLANMSSPIPSTVSFEAAAVIPLCLSTAACGMYQKGNLELQYPSLGVASGYEVITTASPRNFDYVKKLGASQVFDYHSKTIVEELVEALKGKTIAGVLDCITIDGAVEVCVEVLSRSHGRKFISTARPTSEDMPGGVKTKWIGFLNTEVSKIIYEDYLPKALAEGKFVPAPEPVVVGTGLHSIQDGLEAVSKGVSAKKVVITL
ncbi:hypothetical protein BZG36_05318 [Bifiguratus adelaidae]|uniref:Enoyl reductase (ER) domain-containing protein n=1 Tax=Bifiguratus adelaidae TaxID=1938954 RepID=A0A261XUT2_9FUNG|nr:hypothetical protein BZG36_05318 [Bifiguratus adelaidae]